MSEFKPVINGLPYKPSSVQLGDETYFYPGVRSDAKVGWVKVIDLKTWKEIFNESPSLTKLPNDPLILYQTKTKVQPGKYRIEWAVGSDLGTAEYYTCVYQYQYEATTPPEPGKTTRAYLIGNSLTDTFKADVVKAIALAQPSPPGGINFEYGRYMIAGASLDTLWLNQTSGFSEAPYGAAVKALTNYDWDHITLQPFDRQIDPKDGMPGDFDNCRRFIDLALARAVDSQPQFWLHEHWPRRDKTTLALDYTAQWNRPYTGNWDGSFETKAFYAQLLAKLNSHYSIQASLAKPIKLIRVGSVMAELDRLIKAGSVPGLEPAKGVTQLYQDEIHLLEPYKSIATLTLYVEMFGNLPVPSTIPASRWPGLTQPILDKILEAIVTVVTGAPATPAIKVRADTEAQLTSALASGATHILTSGLVITKAFDFNGATVELLLGGSDRHRPALDLRDNAVVKNARVVVPPTVYVTDPTTGSVRRTFYKAITVSAPKVGAVLEDVTIESGAGFCIHLVNGKAVLRGVWATKFTEYFMYQEPGTYCVATSSGFKGGSQSESGWRVNAARYSLTRCVLDNSGGGKASIRGDSPVWPDGTPGGQALDCELIGIVGPNPLTEDDGGQMLGIDRWRFAEGWIYQLDSSRKVEAIAFAQSLYKQGKTPTEIVRACADKFIGPDQLASVANGKRKLTDVDIALTLNMRKNELGRVSSFLYERCKIVGGFRVNSRIAGVVKGSTVESGVEAPFMGNSQYTYPWPIDRVISKDESNKTLSLEFVGTNFKGGSTLGLDFTKFTGVKFTNSLHNGKAISVA